MLWTIKVGLIKARNQIKPLKYSEKTNEFLTNLEQQIVKRTAPDLNTKPETTQQKLPCALKKSQVVAAPTKRPKRSSSESTSRSHLQRSMDWRGRACGLASQVTRPHTNGPLPMGLHESLDLHVTSWFWRGLYCPYPCDSSNLAFWASKSISAASLTALYWGRWPYVWISALNW